MIENDTHNDDGRNNNHVVGSDNAHDGINNHAANGSDVVHPPPQPHPTGAGGRTGGNNNCPFGSDGVVQPTGGRNGSDAAQPQQQTTDGPNAGIGSDAAHGRNGGADGSDGNNVMDPKTILLQNVDCYANGLLASFKRTTLNQMVHEVLILYPQSEYAIKKERPILHQRCGRRAGCKVGCTYITFEWKHIKEVLRVFGKKAPGCRECVKHFCDCFVNNVNNIGCTKTPMLGRWCGI